jgi:hypothetical protein
LICSAISRTSSSSYSDDEAVTTSKVKDSLSRSLSCNNSANSRTSSTENSEQSAEAKISAKSSLSTGEASRSSA